MPNDKLPPRRRSLRTVTPKKAHQEQTVESGVSKDSAKKRRPRRPRTYARMRHDAEESAIRAARSATISLETRNCGEGRISLGTNAIPLPDLMVEGDESKFLDASSSDESETGATYQRKRGGRKRNDKDKDCDENEGSEKLRNESYKLREFLREQAVFWNEVDEYKLEEQ